MLSQRNDLPALPESHHVKHLASPEWRRGPQTPSASGNILTSTALHQIHDPEATAISSNGIPKSVDLRRPLRAASLWRTLIRRTPPTVWPTPLQDDTSSPGKVPRRTRCPGKGFCVLSLDGGGCRGYISLLTLRHLLKQLQPDGPIYPYLYFDLICGSSTGGLITILLAVLHLDIDTAIKIYVTLIRKVFLNGFSMLRYLRKDAGYSRKPLERAIAKILRDYGGSRTFMEDTALERRCRSFVTTTHCVRERRSVLAVRSYRPPGGMPTIPNGHQWTCRDAALATAAAPTFFKRHLISEGDHVFSFEDAGAHRTNNPTKVALEECQRLDAEDNELNASSGSLFISLGTGTREGASDPEVPGYFGLFQNKMNALRASTRYATDVKEIHKWMKGKAGDNNMSYFRLNPPLGHKIGLGDWEEVPAMEESVAQYCDRKKYKTRIQDCVDKLDQFQTAERRKNRD